MKVNNSTFEASPMLGPAELGAVAGTRVARLDIYLHNIYCLGSLTGIIVDKGHTALV